MRSYIIKGSNHANSQTNYSCPPKINVSQKINTQLAYYNLKIKLKFN